MRGVATQWAPEGNEWRIQTHQAYGASRADTGRPDADAIRRMQIPFLLMHIPFDSPRQPDSNETLANHSGRLVGPQPFLFLY